MYGPKSKNSHPVRSKGGVLLTTPEEIKERWVEHFSELLNHRTEVDLSIVEDIEQNPINDSLDDPITESELDQALKNTKLGKQMYMQDLSSTVNLQALLNTIAVLNKAVN